VEPDSIGVARAGIPGHRVIVRRIPEKDSSSIVRDNISGQCVVVAEIGDHDPPKV